MRHSFSVISTCLILPLFLLSGCKLFKNTVRHKSHKVSYGSDDGRFTLGGDGKPLMYGYPKPRSTSHFILRVDGYSAINSPTGAEGNLRYFSGERKLSNREGSLAFSIEMMLDDVFVTQRLIPVDDSLRPVKEGELGQYYHITYEIENRGKKRRSVGLLCLLDIMLDDNDAAKIQFRDTFHEYEMELTGPNMPDSIYAYRDVTDFEDHTSLTVLSPVHEEAPFEKASRFFIGRWRYFHQVEWEVKPRDVRYYDSGILLRWDEATLEPGGKRTLGFYHGLATRGSVVEAIPNNISLDSMRTPLALVDTTPPPAPEPAVVAPPPAPPVPQTHTLTLYFDTKEHTLNDRHKIRIDSLMKVALSGAALQTVTIEGNADAQGETENNQSLSGLRAQAVAQYLLAQVEPENVMEVLALGEKHALQNAGTQKNGYAPDRKVRISLHVLTTPGEQPVSSGE